MTALDIKILERKLEFMRRALKEIERITSMSEKKFLSDAISQAVLERQIERLVEASVDAGSHLLRQKFETTAATYRDTFLEMGRRKLIDSELAEQLAPFAGLRNFIVHQYDEIDPKKVLAGAKAAVGVFPPFMAAIRKIAK